MTADQTRTLRKNKHLEIGRPHPPAPTRYSQTNCGPRRVPVLCRAEQRGADEPERRESAAATMAWRTVHMSDVQKSIGRSKRARFEVCTDKLTNYIYPRNQGGSPRKGKAMPLSAPQVGVATSN